MYKACSTSFKKAEFLQYVVILSMVDNSKDLVSLHFSFLFGRILNYSRQYFFNRENSAVTFTFWKRRCLPGYHQQPYPNK
jgi:hypothetical protein